MLIFVFLLSCLNLDLPTQASPLAEPEPEAEAEPSFGGFPSDSSSVGGFYTPVYYQSQQGQYPGYTYRFGPPLPPLQEQASDLGGNSFRDAFTRAFNQYITSGLLNNYKRGKQPSHTEEDRDEELISDLHLGDSDSELSEEGDVEEAEDEENKYPDYEDDGGSSVSDNDQLPVIEIFK